MYCAFDKSFDMTQHDQQAGYKIGLLIMDPYIYIGLTFLVVARAQKTFCRA